MRVFKVSLVCVLILYAVAAKAQNVGIGTTNPGQKLDVNGKVRTNGIILNNGGSQYDFLMKSSVTGEVGFKKGNGGLGLNYIICIQGAYPSPGGPPPPGPMLGEIRLFAGFFAPSGWAFCLGQILSLAQNTALFSILGTTYGGNGFTTFGLPDLRGAVPIGSGTAMVGYQWLLGEKTY